MKLSLINKKLGLKIGNLVYYIDFKNEKMFCIITDIKNDKVYGNWKSSIESAKRVTDDYSGWMQIDRCFNETE